jgi:tetratricopeptide (TPR) repeat protein
MLRLQLNIQDVQSGELLNITFVEGQSLDDFIPMVHNLADSVRNYLEFEALKEEAVSEMRRVTTRSAAAYLAYHQGMDAFFSFDSLALQSFLKAVEIDSNFMMAQIFVAYQYHDRGPLKNPHENIREMKKWVNRVYKAKNRLSHFDQIYVEFFMAHMEKRPADRIRWGKELVRLDPQIWEAWHNIGFAYYRQSMYEEAIAPFETAVSLAKQWGSEGRLMYSQAMLISCYHEIGDHQRELEIKKQMEDNPFFSGLSKMFKISISQLMASAYLCLGDTVNANLYLDKMLQNLRDKNTSESEILTVLGSVNSAANRPDQAELYYRQAMEMDPNADDSVLQGLKNQAITGNAKLLLAHLLIESEKNVDEGVILAENEWQRLQAHPHAIDVRIVLGRGYFKQGNYAKAAEMLQQADDMKPRYWDYIRVPLEKALAELVQE